MYMIRKKIRFEMSHILNSSYSEDCQKIHGHSYVLEVFLKSSTLNDDGMIKDFGLIKKILAKVRDTFDHKFVVNIDHPQIIGFVELEASVGGIYYVHYNPTAEEMAKDIYNMIKPYVKMLHKVRLHETETGYAEYWEE